MKTAFSTVFLSAEASVEDIVAAANAAGCNAIDLAIASTGLLTFATPAEECLRIAKAFSSAGLSIVALTVVDAAENHLASSCEDIRRLVQDRIRAAIGQAALMDVRTVVLAPAVVGGSAASKLLVRYETAYRLVLDSLLELRFEAGMHAVRLACLNCNHHFLLSPIETRDFIDRINSAWVGVCLDVAATIPVGSPSDWIRSLAARVFHVCVGKFDSSEEEAEMMDALKEVRYGGAVTRSIQS